MNVYWVWKNSTLSKKTDIISKKPVRRTLAKHKSECEGSYSVSMSTVHVADLGPYRVIDF